MTRSILTVSLALLASAVSTPALHADSVESGPIAQSVAGKYGLERAWFTQLRLTPGRERVESMRLQVNQAESQTIVRVLGPSEQTFEFSDRHLNVFGKPLGVEGAQRAAEDRVRLLGLYGIEAQIEQKVVPDITLYATTQSGIIHAIDAETGGIRWVTTVGKSSYPTTSPAVNDQYVAVINGQTLYVLDAKTGTLLRDIRVVGATATAPAIVGRTIFVPLLTGHLRAYSIGEGDPTWPDTYFARGIVEYPPTVAGNLVAWSTDAGTISVISARRDGILYRIRLPEPVAGPLFYAPPTQLLAVTRSGYLFSFNVTDGGLMWRFSSGDDTGEPAAMVGDTVYLISRRAGIIAVSAQDGKQKWSAPHPRQFVAATQSKVYASTLTGQLVVLDANTGSTIGQIPLNPTDHVFINNQTDRIYIGNQAGVLQCLHESGARWPTVHSIGREVPSEGGTPGPKPKSKVDPADALSDPFQVEPTRNVPADPFEVDEADDRMDSGEDDDADPFG